MVSISESDSTKYQNDSGLGFGHFFCLDFFFNKPKWQCQAVSWHEPQQGLRGSRGTMGSTLSSSPSAAEGGTAACISRMLKEKRDFQLFSGSKVQP